MASTPHTGSSGVRGGDGGTVHHGPHLLLLSACAGSVDLLSIALLGGALSGILTGDLVNTADAIGSERWTLIRYPAVAVGFFCLGVAVWSAAQRRARTTPSRARRTGLRAELVLLLYIPVGLAVTHGRPGEAMSVTLLGAAAAAMGAQSAISLGEGASTTYMTGAITTAVHDLVNPGPRRVRARQLESSARSRRRCGGDRRAAHRRLVGRRGAPGGAARGGARHPASQRAVSYFGATDTVFALPEGTLLAAPVLLGLELVGAAVVEGRGPTPVLGVFGSSTLRRPSASTCGWPVTPEFAESMAGEPAVRPEVARRDVPEPRIRLEAVDLVTGGGDELREGRRTPRR